MPPTLEGTHVRLRAPREDDVPFCLAFANDPEMRGWLRFERPKPEEDERAWLKGLDDTRDRVWIMEDVATGRSLGIASLNNWHHVARHAELGLAVLNPDDRDKGYGSETVKLLLRHAFTGMNLQRVHLTVHEDNPARRLYERHGFRQEGRLARHAFKRGAFRDVLVMGILREEWRE